MNQNRLHQVTPTSGEVVITDSEWTGDVMRDSDYFYTEVAKRFFNQFLELKVQMDSGALSKPDGFDKEVRQYKKLIGELRKASQDLVEDNKRLEEALALAENELTELRAKYNAAVMDMGRLQEKLQGLGVVQREAQRVGYSFSEHMSEESKREWEKLMQAIPRPGDGM